MKKAKILPATLFSILFCLSVLYVSAQETLSEQSDRLYNEDRNREAYRLLKAEIPSVRSRREQAELYWRLARSTLEIGYLLEDEGASSNELLETFVEGEGYADRAIELDPNNHNGYYWKSANTGRWGEIKGILNALFKAKPMRDLLNQALEIYPEHPASFYVLGIMYERVPGWPLSFGNSDYSVSLGRKAVDANKAEFETGLAYEIKLDYYLDLARHLYKRNWNVRKRNREQSKKAERYAEANDVLEKNYYYEGVVRIPDMTDREEAMELIEWVIEEFEALPWLRRSQRLDLDGAREDLRTWTGRR